MTEYEINENVEEFIKEQGSKYVKEIGECAGIQPGHMSDNYEKCEFCWTNNEVEMITQINPGSERYRFEISKEIYAESVSKCRKRYVTNISNTGASNT